MLTAPAKYVVKTYRKCYKIRNEMVLEIDMQGYKKKELFKRVAFFLSAAQ
jgi:hypothetical protein